MLIFLFFLATSQETNKETPNIKMTGITKVGQPKISIISYSLAKTFMRILVTKIPEGKPIINPTIVSHRFCGFILDSHSRPP